MTHLIGTVFRGHRHKRTADPVHSPVLGSQVPCWLQVQGTQLA